MSYMTAQALLKTKLLTCPSFGANDVTEGDIRILDLASTNMAILFPGSLPDWDLGMMTRVRQYEASLDLFTQYTGDAAWAAFGTLRDAVISTLLVNRCMSAAYWITGIASEGQPVEVYDKAGGGPYFITQRLRLQLTENV